MIDNFRKKLVALKDNILSEIEHVGGVHIFMITVLVFLLALPFLLIYYLLLKPAYSFICMLFDIREMGVKTSYRRHFHSEEYEEEERKRHNEEKKAKEALFPSGRQKKFDDFDNWPDAYVIDGVAVYGAEGRTLLFVDERVTEFDVPEGVENIYHRCFACCDGMTRVSIPSTVKRIGKRAFFSCVSLKEVFVPESVSIVDEEMFLDCSSLEHVELPSHITEIPIRMFSNCRSLRYFKLPDEVTAISEESFRRCYSLERIDTNDKLEIVGKKAFEDCHSLKEFIMPDSVKRCIEGMFNGCHSLEHIHFSPQIKDFGGSCCRDCWSINRISMPADEHMQNYAKENWEKYSDKVDINQSENPIPKSFFWTMDDALYFGIPRLTSVCLMFCFTKDAEYTIPSFVSNIKRDAFTSCKNLRTLCLSPYIKTSCDPWEHNSISYGFIYDYWPQIEHVVFDESLKHTKYAFGLIA